MYPEVKKDELIKLLMKSILCIRGVPHFRGTLDRLTYMNVELRPVPMEFRGRIPRAFMKPGYTCRAIKARATKKHLMERLCAGLRKI